MLEVALVFLALSVITEDKQSAEEKLKALKQRVRLMLTPNTMSVPVCACLHTKMCFQNPVCQRESGTVVEWASGPAASGETSDSY